MLGGSGGTKVLRFPSVMWRRLGALHEGAMGVPRWFLVVRLLAGRLLCGCLSGPRDAGLAIAASKVCCRKGRVCLGGPWVNGVVGVC